MVKPWRWWFSIVVAEMKFLRRPPWGFPIVTYIDTPGAFTDLKSEELGQAIVVYLLIGSWYCEVGKAVVEWTARKYKVKRSMKEPVVSNTLADIPHNEYSWIKYEHEPIKGFPHPRKFRHQMIITRSVMRSEVTIQLEVVPYDVCGSLREHQPIGSSLRALAKNKTVGLIGVSHKRVPGHVSIATFGFGMENGWRAIIRIKRFLMWWLSFIKLKPKQFAECNQQKRASPRKQIKCSPTLSDASLDHKVSKVTPFILALAFEHGRSEIIDHREIQMYAALHVVFNSFGILQLVILGAESRRNVPEWLLRIANDRVAWNKYPWGSYVWSTLYSQLRKANVRRWGPL
nr:protein WRKY1 [Tanacetum cinerariifolium]